MFGTGKGGFQGGTSVSAGPAINPSQVIIADLNGDGKQDIAFIGIGTNSSTLWVFLNTGNGNFAPGVSYSTGGLGAEWLAVGDFNGDQKMDVVVSNTQDRHAHGSVSVLLGNGDGTFQAPISFPLTKKLGNVAVGDFNKDGHLDVAVAMPDDNNNADQKLVQILFGNGDGTLSLGPLLDSGPNPQWAEVGDFNGDGSLDIAVCNSPTGGTLPSGITVMLGNGDGTFQPGTRFSLGGVLGVKQLVVADFNGDKKPDIAVVDNSTASITILINATTFPAPR